MTIDVLVHPFHGSWDYGAGDDEAYSSYLPSLLSYIKDKSPILVKSPVQEITQISVIDHPESKFENGTESGTMKRRHIKNCKICFTGKEVKNIELQPIKVDNTTEFKDMNKLRNIILRLTPQQGRECGIIHRSSLTRLKTRSKKGKLKINKITKKIIEHYF